MSNPFDFITRLPDAVITPPFEKHPGIFIQAAMVEGKGHNVFIEVIYGPKCPQVTYTLNIGGRGALVFGEQEFSDLLSSGLALFEVRSLSFVGDQPTSPQAAALPEVPAILTDADQSA